MAEVSDVRLLKSRYSTVKLLLKKWENAYKQEHGERPHKESIHSAPLDIKNAYKTYWKLTKQFFHLKNEHGKDLSSSNFVESLDNYNYSKGCKNSNSFNLDSHEVNNFSSNIESNSQSSLSNISGLGTCDTNDSCTQQFSRKSTDVENPVLENNTVSIIMSDNSQNEVIATNNKYTKCPVEDNDIKFLKDNNETNAESSQVVVWGKHLNKKSVNQDNPSDVEVSLYSKMAENMKCHAVVRTRKSLKRVPSKICKDNIKKSEPSCNKNENSVPVERDDCNVDVLFSPIKSNERIQGTKLNLPNFCIVKKGTTKMISKSVNHFSLDKDDEINKIENRKWNDDWVRRCTTDIDEQESAHLEHGSNNREAACDEINHLEQNNKVESKSNNNSIVLRNETLLQPKDKAEDDAIMYNSENICKQMNISENVCKQMNNSENVCKQMNNSENVCKQMNISENLLKRKLSQRNSSFNSEELNEHANISIDTKDDTCGEDKNDKNIYSYEDEEWSPEPKRKKVTRQKPVKGVKVSKIKTETRNTSLRKRTSARKTKPDDECLDKERNVENILPDYDELEVMGNTNAGQCSTKSKRFFSKEERIQYKIANGKLNDNFVKINLKKKVFVRGKRRMTSEKYKRFEWKKKQIEKKAESGDQRSIKKLTCHRCGDFGHWANKCTGKIGGSLMSLDAYNEQESTFLTLEEASDLASGCKTPNEYGEKITRIYKNDSQSKEDEEDETFSDWDDDFISSVDGSGKKSDNNDTENISSLVNSNNKNAENVVQCVRPLYNLDSDGCIIATPTEVYETLNLFGHKSFRKGQETVVMRILSGQSTLVVQSTGSGKSLCYQLPAYLYSKHFNCITLCVSPLVSLMEDQVTGLPSILKAVCLHTQQSPANRDKAMNSLRAGNVHILLVSPEAIVSSRGGGILGTLLKELPPVAFACLDEAHCLSEWSHNFRPSYLQVCQILKERFRVNTFLGLTATARNETAMSIAKHLQISLFNQGVIMGSCIPDNLVLSVSRDAKREEALIHILTGERFEGCSSVIIYCTRREECERIATFIRTQMVTASKIDVKSNAKRSRGISLDAEAYHAGLSGFRRQQIQKRFMSGKLRIVVATVAFGMGIDKADVQGIIHFNMPRNLESYVQEIGRAGRDGNTAHCHLFLDNCEGRDIQELKRHIFVNSVDRFTVRKLLNKIFAHQNCIKVTKLLEVPNVECTEDLPNESRLQNDDKQNAVIDNSTTKHDISCPGHEVALPINDLIESLDMPEENIQTLLCYMEMHPKCRLNLSHHAYATCIVSCYGGSKQLCMVSKKCPPLAVAIALQRKQGKSFEKVNSITFPVVEISSQMGWSSRIVKQELKNLEWINNGLGFKPSGVKVEFSDLAFHMTCRCDLSDEEQDQVLEDIYERARKQEKDQLKQLQYTYQVLCKASHSSIILCCDNVDEEKSNFLKEKIRVYFSLCNEGGLHSVQLEEQLYIRPEIEQRIRQDVRSLLSIHTDQSWTGRAVARVLHGISSPNFPAKVWGKVRKFWRLHLETDFNLLLSIATKEILKFR